MAICGCYVVAVLLDVAVTILHFIQSKEFYSTVVRNIFILHGVLLISMFTLTYTYIAYIMYTKRVSVAETQETRLRDNLNCFVPFLIVIAHSLFVLTPNVIYLFYPTHIPNMYQSAVWRLLWTVNFTADAVICIVLNGTLRNKFWRRVALSRSRIGTSH